MFGFNYHGRVTISNTIVIANGPALRLNAIGEMYCGAITGRAKTSPFFENSYIISEGLIAANGITTDPHSQAYGKINVLPIIYADEQAFITARDENAINLSNYADFWDLTKDVPCFK